MSIANPPKLKATLNFSQIGASSTNFVAISGLSRNAIKRTVFIANSLDQPLSDIIVYATDSTIALSGENPSDDLGKACPNNQVTTLTSDEYHMLASNSDEIILGIKMGVTAPLAGSVSVYVVELI